MQARSQFRKIVHSDKRKWTLKRMQTDLEVQDACCPASLPSIDDWKESNEKWKGIGFSKRFDAYFNPLVDGNMQDFGCTRLLLCLELLVEPEMLREDVIRLLDTHGYTKCIQQWKVRNFILSIGMASSILFGLAIAGSGQLEMPFQLGNCLPRSILFPFTGREGKGCRHLIKDADRLTTEYNVSSLNTLAFVERSEAMDASERWTNGNVCAEYVKVHERVSNISRKLDGKDAWIGRQNRYVATGRLKRLVLLARQGKLHFVEIDCKDLRKWFIESYVDSESGKLLKGRMLNARKDWPDVWKRYTGLRPASDINADVERFSTIAAAMTAHEKEILDGSLVWTTHLEKILRGIIIGDSKGRTLQEIAEEPQALPSFNALPKEEPRPSIIGKSEISINVEFSQEAVQKALAENPNRKDIGQLQSLLANGRSWNGHDWIRLYFRRRRHGRFYGYGNSIQMLSKSIRRKVFPAYAMADLNCGVYSIMKCQLDDNGYEGDLSEIEAMVQDKGSYRKSLVDQELHISLDDVKQFLTMIGYGCTINIGKIVDAAEWNWLVEAYGIETTMYDAYRHSPGSALAGGVADPFRLMQIAEWASNSKVQGLWKEMQDGGMFLFGKMKKRSSSTGHPVLCNAWNEELDIKSKRVSFGQKLAHIYQGAESMVLWNIMDGFRVDGNLVKESPFGFGIPMHDGIGIHKDIVGSNASALIERHVLDNFGWSLKYDCE